MRIALKVAYDGTNYHGWQFQDNACTIEGELNKALFDLLNTEISVIGASRTDAGVHAFGNMAVFDSTTSIPPERIMYALNERLPEDIRIMESRLVPDSFHPRFDAKNKTYIYQIIDSPILLPTYRLYYHHTKYRLSDDLMNEAAGFFVGEHDFTSVASVHSQTTSFVRVINSCEVNRDGDVIKIIINGDGFLYNMVRIISGTLLQVGAKKLSPKDIPDILKAKDRAKAGPTLPPNGLTLAYINYCQ